MEAITSIIPVLMLAVLLVVRLLTDSNNAMAYSAIVGMVIVFLLGLIAWFSVVAYESVIRFLKRYYRPINSGTLEIVLQYSLWVVIAIIVLVGQLANSLNAMAFAAIALMGFLFALFSIVGLFTVAYDWTRR